MQLCEEWLDVTASSSCVNWGRGAIPQAVSCVVGATNDPELERRLEDGVMDAVRTSDGSPTSPVIASFKINVGVCRSYLMFEPQRK